MKNFPLPQTGAQCFGLKTAGRFCGFRLSIARKRERNPGVFEDFRRFFEKSGKLSILRGAFCSPQVRPDLVWF